MEQNKTTTETNAQPIVAVDTANDAEAKIAALEAEKAKLLTERDNYKTAYLKDVKKDGSRNPEETDEERARRIVREELMNSQISKIDSEKEALLQKALKENKELKLAQLNKGAPLNSTTTSTDTVGVKDT